MDMQNFIDECHKRSKAAGWWHDPITGLSLIPGLEPVHYGYDHVEVEPIIKAWFPFVLATKIALIHSEVSEGLEFLRTNSMDDKLPQFKGITVEMADAMIRIGDLIGVLQAFHGNEDYPMYDLVAAITTKFEFNNVRADHGLEARAKPGGKRF